MFAQVFPLFQDASVFTTIPVLYADGFMDAAVRPSAADPTMQGVVAILALAANVIVLAVIIKRSLAQKKNPYTGGSSPIRGISSLPWQEPRANNQYGAPRPKYTGPVLQAPFFMERTTA